MKAGLTLPATLAHLEALAPLRLATQGDPVGLVVEPLQPRIRRVLCCIDFTASVAAEAVAWNCELVVAYHPPLYRPLAQVAATSPVAVAVRAGCGLYAPHTALDAAAGGTNDGLADALGMVRGRRRLALEATAGNPKSLGQGRVGPLAGAAGGVMLQDVLGRLSTALGLAGLLLGIPDSWRTKAQAMRRPLRRLAVAAGAVDSLAPAVRGSGAEMLVAGELRHHTVLALHAAGIAVACTLHTHSERLGLRAFSRRLTARAPQLVVRLSERDHDPLQWI